MKTTIRRGMAAILCICMMLGVFVTASIPASATTADALQLEFIVTSDKSASANDVAEQLGTANVHVQTFAGYSAAASGFVGNTAQPHYVIVELGAYTTADKANVKNLLTDIRSAYPLATVIIGGATGDAADSTAIDYAVDEVGGSSAKFLCTSATLSNGMGEYVSGLIAQLVLDTKTVLEQSNQSFVTSGMLSTDIWRSVPMVSQSMRDAGYVGGEGCQWIQSIAYSHDGSHVLISSDTSTVWRSDDDGNTWAPSSVGFESIGATGIMFDPKNSNRVLASTASNGAKSGAFLSIDGGNTWTRVTAKNGTADAKFYFNINKDDRDMFAYDPTSYDAELGYCTDVYWLTQQRVSQTSANYTFGLFKSTDGGVTFSYISNSEQYAGGEIVIDNNGNIYIAMDLDVVTADNASAIAGKNAASAGLYRSADDGASFSSVGGFSTKVYSMEVLGSNMWVTTGDGLYKSTNGTNFSRINSSWPSIDYSSSYNDYDGIFYPDFLRVDPHNHNNMFIQNNGAKYIASGTYARQTYRSTDGGVNWSLVTIPATNSDNTINGLWSNYSAGEREHLFAFDPVDSGIVIATGGDFLNKSTDSGATWTISNTGYSSMLVGGGWNFNPNNPNLIALGSQDYNGGFSTDGGNTWNYMKWNTANWGGYVYGSYALTDKVVVGGHADKWISRGGTVYIYETFDGGNSFNRDRSTTTGIKVDSPYNVVSGVHGDNNVVFLGEWRGVLNSTATDITWTKMSACDGVFASYATDTGHLLIGAKYNSDTDVKIVYSTDKGVTWTVWYAATSGLASMSDIAYNVKTDTVYVTNSSWSLYAIPRNFTGTLCETQPINGATGVCVDPSNPDIMYVTATENGNNITYRNVFRSLDAGKSWHLLSRQVGDGRVGVDGANRAERCRVNPVTNELYVTTHCNGVWKMSGLPSMMHNGDSITSQELRELIAIYNNLTVGKTTTADSAINWLHKAELSIYESETPAYAAVTSDWVTLADSSDYTGFVEHTRNDYTDKFGINLPNGGNGTTDKSVSSDIYHLGSKFKLETSFYSEHNNHATNSLMYFAIGDIYVVVDLFKTNGTTGDGKAGVYLTRGNINSPRLIDLTSTDIDFDYTTNDLTLEYNNGNITLTLLVNGDTEYSGKYELDPTTFNPSSPHINSAHVSTCINKVYNTVYLDRYTISTAYSVDDLIAEFEQFDPNSDTAAVDATALEAKFVGFGDLSSAARSAVTNYFGGSLPTDVPQASALSIVVDDGYGSVLVNGTAYSPYTSYSTGTQYTLTAVANTGYKFLAWVGDDANNVLSTDPVFDITTSDSTKVHAIFGATGSTAGQRTLLFVSRRGIVATKCFAEVGAVLNSVSNPALPSGQSIYGLTFTGWNDGTDTYLNSYTVTDSAVLYAKYSTTPITNTYTVRIFTEDPDEPVYSAQHQFNSKVTATATGEGFAGWTKNGVIISFNPVYTFYVSGDADIRAVYGSAGEVKPMIIITDHSAQLNNNNTVISFIMERSFPQEGYTYIESGFLLSENAYDNDQFKLENVNNTTIQQVKSGYASSNGQFKLTVNTNGGRMHARAYLTYYDLTLNERHTVYSDQVFEFAAATGPEHGGMVW